MVSAHRRLALRDIRALPPNTEIWDSAVPGFGARRQRSEAVAYVLVYRTAAGRQRRLTIGRHGAPWTPDAARDEARRLLGRVASGEDPASDKRAARNVTTIAQLCDDYLTAAEAGRILTRRRIAKSESTLVSDRGRIVRHIKPLLGRLSVNAVTREDVEAFMHAVAEGRTAGKSKTKPRGLSNVRGGRGAASRTVGLLGGIFSYAIKQRLCSENPVRGVDRFADQRRDRRLSSAEYGRLGVALGKAEAEQLWPPAIAATRFLAFTGWRSGEVLGLRWDNIDLERRVARLGATKTGISVRPLPEAACMLLRELAVTGEALVFPASRGNGQMTGYRKFWLTIAARGELARDISPHVLRHSFASVASDIGYSEPTIAALIGHKGHSITSRYVHSADAVLLAAAASVARRIIELMDGEVQQATNGVNSDLEVDS